MSQVHVGTAKTIAKGLCWFMLQVDQPGSLIDTYVDKLELIIQEKSKGIRDLQKLLDSFKGRLQQEEVFSKSMGKNKKKSFLK